MRWPNTEKGVAGSFAAAIAILGATAGAISSWSTIETFACSKTGLLCSDPPGYFRLSAIKTAELQISEVDDFMNVDVNDHIVERAKFGDTPPPRDIKSYLKAGPNKISVTIINGQYGGCGGNIKLWLDGVLVPELSRTYATPMKDASVNGMCEGAVMTLQLH